MTDYNPYIYLLGIQQKMYHLQEDLTEQLLAKNTTAAEKDIQELQELTANAELSAHGVHFAGFSFERDLLDMAANLRNLNDELKAGNFTQALQTDQGVGNNLQDMYHLLIGG